MIGWIVLGVFIFAVLAVIATAYVCFFRIFFSRRRPETEEFPIPDGEIYLPHRERMINWMKELRAAPHADVSVVSFDGLTLRGKFYEYEKGAPIELMLHGYRGSSERDLCGGASRCFALGHSALIIDHRGSGKSDGRVISFGINESRDATVWIDYIINNIDKNAKIILTGISMGAATAMICAGEELPSNVVGVLADCGYTSAKDIIMKVMTDMKLPPRLLYPFAKLGAKMFGKFDLEEKSPIESMKRCRLPIIFFHGDTDDYVPHYMSVENYNACASEYKKLVTTKNAGHGLCFVIDSENYIKDLKDFFEPVLRK
jgi:fermentation-respiration switch protein FrsA (DUF1100 family)